MTFGGIAQHRQRLGAHGERLAAQWYTQAGYSIVAQNWRCSIGEIDLVVRRGSVLVIAEVKTRASNRFGIPAEAVNLAKQRKLRSLAHVWLAASAEYYDEVRFDVVSISGRDVDVIEAAF